MVKQQAELESNDDLGGMDGLSHNLQEFLVPGGLHVGLAVTPTRTESRRPLTQHTKGAWGLTLRQKLGRDFDHEQ